MVGVALPEPLAEPIWTADPEPGPEPGPTGVVVAFPEQAAITKGVNALRSRIARTLAPRNPRDDRPKRSDMPSRALVSPIDRYIDATFTRFQRTLAATRLDEPMVDDPLLALRRVGFLVETLTAFAVGHAVGRVGELVRRTSDASVRQALEAQLATVAIRPAYGDRETLIDAPRGVRPLVAELHHRLHARLWLAAGQAHALLTAIDATVARVAPERLATITTTLAVLSEDEALALAFADQLELGWRFFIAIASGLPDPVVADGPRWRRGRALWAAWAQRARGEQVTRPGRDGYIVRVA